MSLKLMVVGAAIAGLCAGQAVALQKAVALAPAQLYLSPDASSSKLGEVRPGMEIGIQSASGAFVQIFAGVSGWMANHGYVKLDDPQAPELIFGAGVGFETQAESGSGQDQAALDAARLYLSIYSDFPASARAAEALYRAAEIRWELKLSQMPRRRTPEERQFPDDMLLRRVEAKFPNSPWAARAAYQLIIEHFTCGDWTEKPQCVEKEIDRYRDYVNKYPSGPYSAEAAYDALYRQGIAWTLYLRPGPRHDQGKAEQYQRALAQQADAIARAYPGTDWAAQAALLAFNAAHGIPLEVPGTTPLGGP
ncbi:MAG: hypothetical protein ACRD1E_00030 [Terriglobales bacterium]